ELPRPGEGVRRRLAGATAGDRVPHRIDRARRRPGRGGAGVHGVPAHVQGSARAGSARRVARGHAPAARRGRAGGAVARLARPAASREAVLLRRGEVEGAEQLLGSLSGPRVSRVRSRMALRRGDVAAARAALVAAAPALHGAEATETIALATLLGRVSATGADVLSRALMELARDRTADAVALLSAESGHLTAEERPAILDYAAQLADGGELEAEA